MSETGLERHWLPNKYINTTIYVKLESNLQCQVNLVGLISNLNQAGYTNRNYTSENQLKIKVIISLLSL